jgi:hypothetical protein
MVQTYSPLIVLPRITSSATCAEINLHAFKPKLTPRNFVEFWDFIWSSEWRCGVDGVIFENSWPERLIALDVEMLGWLWEKWGK